MACTTALLLGVGLLLINPLAATEIYKWVDSNGNVHFSDKKPASAESEKIEIRSGSTSPSQPATEAVASESDKAQAANNKATSSETPQPQNPPPPIRYSKLEITLPENDQAVRANNGEIRLLCSLEPALQSKAQHRIRFYLNGKALPQTSTSCSMIYTGLERGTHSAYVEIIDDTGSVLKRSDVHRFHVMRHSIL